MKNLSWKKIGLAALIVGVLAVVIYRIAGSGESAQYVNAGNPAFGEYISSYTAGVIGSGSSVRIVLARDAVDSTAVGQEATSKLLDFTPSLTGKSRWLDSRTLEFRPDSRMLSGQLYKVKFRLSKLFKVPEALSDFLYTFQVIPQNFELAVDNIKPYIKSELKRQKLEGKLTTSDFAEGNAVEQVLQAKQDGSLLKISWTHAGDGKQHDFVVENVQRKDSAGVVKLIANGKALGNEQQDEREIEVPALNDFRVMNVRVEQSGNQHVVLQFTDPLNEKQDVRGIVSVADMPGVEFEIKDNEILIYPPVKQIGTKTIVVDAGVRNVLDYRMKKAENFSVVFEPLKPAVRFTGKGSILPGTDGMVMPFEAVNLKSVDVQIIKVFENNVLQFLQVNDLAGNSEMRRVGRPVLKKTIQLDNSGVTDLGKWNRFTLDLTTLINAEPGAIYQVKISFRKAYLAYVCEEGEAGTAPNEMATTEQENWNENPENSYWDSYEDYYYTEGYEWDQRDNPCHVSYYTGDRNISRNILASDLGLLAKQGSDGNALIVVNDIKTTKPLAGVLLEVFDYQQQQIGTATTDGDGKAIVRASGTPFALVAKNGTQRGYLRLFDGESLSLSNFDVGGDQVRKGLKGFLYGERGVWRPGDSLFLSFILEDKLKLMPPAHPVVFELQSPQGLVTSRIVRATSENGFYKFVAQTAPDAPTGTWTARVKVGGTEFSQPIRIEMVKPNRLKLNLDFGVDKLKAGTTNVSGNLQVNWLQGPPGKNLKAFYEVVLTRGETKFSKYTEYSFEDPSRTFTNETKEVFNGVTDANGHAIIHTDLSVSQAAPGVLNAIFRGKVFEESGNFSLDRIVIPFYPFTSFTGIRLPQGDKARGMLLTDTTHQVSVVTIDAEGQPVSRDRIEMTLYKLEWRWWWDHSGEENANFMSDQYAKTISTGTLSTVNGKGSWGFKISYPQWGRYFVKAYDPVSGHSTGKIVYIDWPNWAGRSRGGTEGATMLTFSSDKPAYNVGEKMKLMIPGSDGGRALISVENGSHVIETFWLETKKGDNAFSFDVTGEMTPNVFVHVTLLQPHAQTVNDLPIRLYGVIPIMVENPETRLTPVISMPDVLEPGQEVVIRVSEKFKRKMTYTIAVVEEGLLDLTHFKTPDPWNRFYAREALGVKTWDLYDQVLGAMGGRLERLMAIGGDGIIGGKEDDSKTNRFKPVVKYLGPFTLTGESNEHRFVMPPYIGSVKTMLVAGYEGAYGRTEKATPVRKPLMVLATLPRVLGPEENVKLPITLFAMEKGIKDVKIEVKVSGPVKLGAESGRLVTMQGPDLTTDFDLTVKSETGKAKIEVRATSGKYVATDVIDIEVRNPNPPMSRTQQLIVESGKSWSAPISPFGVAGSNKAILEVSTLPPVNLGERLRYLIQYPYGCIEQTTSSVFPQLYLDRIKAMTDAEKATVQTNVKAGIERLKLFVTRDGGFGYWPGYQDADPWGSTYAAHFLVEAESRGYFVPGDMIKRWKKYEKSRAQSWRKSQYEQSSELTQAYRLYVLALAGDPEMGAMNRLMEQGNLPSTASWMLAAAYTRAGQPEAGKKLISQLPLTIAPYQESYWSYGSELRDEAIILETLVLQNDRARAFDLVKTISAALSNSGKWMSTQTVAWCLKSVGSFAGTEQRGSLAFTYQFQGKETTATTDLPLAQVNLPLTGNKVTELKMTNSGKGALFVRLILEGVPARGMEEDEEQNLSLEVAYSDKDGAVVDPASLEQGKEFMATVTVSNNGVKGNLKNLALNQIFPSGWEINNLRLDNVEERLKSDKADYQDIRDDRVYTYFDLPARQRRTFKVMLTAGYAGVYYLPAVSCEAMYDHSIYARKKGKVVAVTKGTSR